MTFIKNLLLLACLFLGTKQSAGSKAALRRRLKLEELEPRVVMSADDIISGANWIGPISQVRTWAGESISPASDVDIYGIYLPAGQRVAIDLDRPWGNLDSFFRLFGSNGIELARNDDGPTPGEPASLESYLEFSAPWSGNFYLGVSSFGNSNYNPITGANRTNGYTTGPYTLNFIPLSNPTAPLDYAGNTMAAARDLGTLTGTRSFQDFVGAADRDDFYRFTLGTRSDFSLALGGLSADADVQVLNNNGGVIAGSYFGGSTAESITRTLDAGVYFIRVFRYSGDTNYTLSIIGQPDFSLRAYRQDNPFWNSGYAPTSTNPPYSLLHGARGNCTWYANGRLRELVYSSADLGRLTGNASTWANTARANGIPVGTVPVVGAIAQTTAGAGHVAIVERVNPDGTILISESSYYVDAVNRTGDFLWRLRTVTASSFQNYIYVRR